MTWAGTWCNQYGSTLVITDESAGRVAGTFRTALPDSGFHGRDFPVLGVHQGDCISFAFAGPTPKGDMVCSFTGLLRDGRLQTVWLWSRTAPSKATASVPGPTPSWPMRTPLSVAERLPNQAAPPAIDGQVVYARRS